MQMREYRQNVGTACKSKQCNTNGAVVNLKLEANKKNILMNVLMLASLAWPIGASMLPLSPVAKKWDQVKNWRTCQHLHSQWQWACVCVRVCAWINFVLTSMQIVSGDGRGRGWWCSDQNVVLSWQGIVTTGSRCRLLKKTERAGRVMATGVRVCVCVQKTPIKHVWPTITLLNDSTWFTWGG